MIREWEMSTNMTSIKKTENKEEYPIRYFDSMGNDMQGKKLVETTTY